MTKHISLADELQHAALRDFDHLLRCYALAGNELGARDLAAQHCSPRVVEITKAPVGGLTTGDPGITGDERSLRTAFFNSLRARSAYDRMRGDMRVVPFRARSAVVTQAAVATAGQGREGTGKTVSRFDAISRTMAELKGSVIGVASKELIEFGDAGTETFIVNELSGALSESVDSAFLTFLQTGATVLTPGTTAHDDLAALLAAVPPLAGSELHWVGSPGVAARLATLQATAGMPAPLPIAPEGTLLGRPFSIVNTLAGSPPAEFLLLADASQLATADGGMQFRMSEQASIQMDDDPDQDATVPTGSTLTNLYQTNSVAFLAERRFAIDRARSSAVAIVFPTWV